MSSPVPPRSVRPWLLVSALGALVLAAVLRQAVAGGFADFPLFDFVEYWAAGRLNARGQNPYDPEAMHRLEREADPHASDILMWNPPWTLTFVMPFGLLGPRAAYLLWLLLDCLALGLSADVLYCVYAGRPGLRWLAWVAALLFLPTFFALRAGQIAPLVLLGAVGFLAFVGRGRGALAGAAAVLLAIKPHLAYLFWVALLLWSLRERRWSVLAGGALAGLAATAIPWLCNRDVLAEFWHTFTHRPPAQYRSPTLGTVLRLALGTERFGLQYLAMLPGLAWFVPHWLRHRRDWSWPEQLPLLLLVSVLTAAYGAWPFDLVLLLVPVIQAAAALSREGPTRRACWAGVLYLAGNFVALVQLSHGVEYFGFIWMTPALLLGYVALRHRGGVPGTGPEATRPLPA